MTRLIKKYTIFVVASIVTVRLLTAIIVTIWPDLLTTKISDSETNTLGTVFIDKGIEYLINIVFVFLIYKEMKNENTQSFPILVLTFFSNLLGVIFFLLVTAYYKLNINQIEHNDKIY